MLPKRCGNDELIGFCFQKLKEDHPRDYALDIIDLINANANVNELTELWYTEVLQQVEDQQIKWIEYAITLGTLAKISLEQLVTITNGNVDIAQINDYLIKSRRFDFYEQSEEKTKSVIKAILNKDISIDQYRRTQYLLEIFISSLDVRRYAIAFSEPQPIPLLHIWQNGRRSSFGTLNIGSILKSPLFPDAKVCYEIIKNADTMSQQQGRTWATTLAPWDSIVENIRSTWGDNWACYHLANVASGINSPTETCKDYSNFLDSTKSLCKRTRYARLRAGVSSWWERQYAEANNNEDKTVIAYLLLTWGSSNVIKTMIKFIDPLISELSDSNWQKLYRLLEEAIEVTNGQSSKRYLEYDVTTLPRKLGARTVTLISLRSKQQTEAKLYQKYLKSYSSSDRIVLEYCQKMTIDIIMDSDDPRELNKALDVIAKSYQKGVISRSFSFHRMFRRMYRENPIPNNIAEQIAHEPQSYPSFLVALAESKCGSLEKFVGR